MLLEGSYYCIAVAETPKTRTAMAPRGKIFLEASLTIVSGTVMAIPISSKILMRFS